MVKAIHCMLLDCLWWKLLRLSLYLHMAEEKNFHWKAFNIGGLPTMI